jgi:uncharacterized protein
VRYYTTARISDNIHETPEGFLLCVGVSIARIGQMIYMDGETPLESDDNGRVLIEREEHEVFRPETMASFEGKPVTIGHPADAVTPLNWSGLAKGIIQNVRRGEGTGKTDLIADLLITDEAAINRVKAGLREVSCGYDASYIQTEPGRGFQTKIVGNHVALVDEGRAGPAYAINDAKGKTVTTKISEKIKALFSKAQDDALALIGTTDDGQAGKTGKTGKTNDKKAKDAKEDDDDDKATKDEDTEGGTSLADVIAMIKALAEKVDAIAKGARTDAPTNDDDAEEESEGDGEESGDGDLADRIEKLEQAVAKLLAREDDADETDVGEEAEEFSDGKNEGGSAGSEDAMPKSTYTGDTASRMEILAPGKKFKGKDAKAQALKAAYATADGKKVIDQLTGKKGLTTDNAAQVNMLFVSASELLKQARQDELAGTKRGRVEDSAGKDSGPMTPERINEINAEYYGAKK